MSNTVVALEGNGVWCVLDGDPWAGTGPGTILFRGSRIACQAYDCDKCAKARKTAGGQWHCVEHGELDI